MRHSYRRSQAGEMRDLHAGRGSARVRSSLLLQGAFSHWSFASATGNPFGAPGGLNALGDRVHGPLVATFSVYDWAVGVWYPKASFLAGQNVSAAGPGPWGGMGADGFQPSGVAATVSIRPAAAWPTGSRRAASTG